ncbi:MAG TPA: response regulator transcription factor [Usitatibacteraceae bacterium]|nr:response regulator transcription factor [Usitatibacteraceae bacterium]
MNKKHRIMVVDDHTIVLHGLKELINNEVDLEVALEAGTAEQALEILATETPDLLITDISLPGLSGLELIKQLQQSHPQLPVLVLSMHDELVHGERAFRLGAKGYLVKQEATEKVIIAIRKILAGDAYISDRMQSMLLQKVRGRPSPQPRSMLASLTDREYEIFRMIGQGLGASEIAAKLQRSVKTVEAHRANLKQKLGLKNAHELNRLAANWADREQV